MEGKRECFACIETCPTGALKIDKGILHSCIRLEGRPALWIDEEKCNNCNQCNEVCPMGNIALSAEGCSFCIICKSHPSCLLSDSGRTSFLNFITSTARFMIAMRRFIFQQDGYNLKRNPLSSS